MWEKVKKIICIIYYKLINNKKNIHNLHSSRIISTVKYFNNRIILYKYVNTKKLIDNNL